MKACFYLMLFGLFALSCSETDVDKDDFKDDNSDNKVEQEYKLVWKEDFDSDILDEKVWNIELVKNPSNNELQEYKAENISIGYEPVTNNKCLIITAKREKTQNRDFTSGRLNTMKKVAFKYGRLDASIKLPSTANGLWPAFWLKGNDNDVSQWPSCGEIDVLEMGSKDAYANNSQGNCIGHACHWGINSSNHKSVGQKVNMQYSLQDEQFHLYTIIWDECSIKFYVDLDKNPNKSPNFIFDYIVNTDGAEKYFVKEFYILLNLAVGGDYTGIWEQEKISALNEKNNNEAKMYIDYVSIYQKGNRKESLIKPVEE